MISEESTMDWDEEELITQPGTGAAMTPSQLVKEYGYPKVTTEGLMKTDKCYLCGSKQFIGRFFRASKDSMIACVRCIYDHLGYEVQADGSLIPVPSDS